MDTPSGNASTDTVTATSATPEVTTVAVPVEPPKAEAPPAEKLSAGYAKLAKERKAAEAQFEALKSERAAFEASQKTSAESLAAYEAAKAEAKRFPLKFLEANGLTYQDLVDAQLNDGQPTANLEVKALKDELEKHKASLETERQNAIKAQAERAAAQEQAILSKFKADTAAQVVAAGDKFELTNLYGHQDRVAQLIELHWNEQIKNGEKSPKMLTFEQAATEIENALEVEAQKIAKSKKFQKFLESKAPVKAPVARVTVTPDVRPDSKSITNSLSATSSPGKKFTAREREARAMAILEAARNN